MLLVRRTFLGTRIITFGKGCSSVRWCSTTPPTPNSNSNSNTLKHDENSSSSQQQRPTSAESAERRRQAVGSNQNDNANKSNSHSNKRARGRVSNESTFTSNIIDQPLPPRPPSYVPPEERDPNDASLAFLKGRKTGDPKRTMLSPHESGEHLASLLENPNADGDEAEVRLEPGQEMAPSLPTRAQRVPKYMDERSAELKSTSVHAGRSLLDNAKVVDSGEYYFHDNTKDGSKHASFVPSSRLADLKRSGASRARRLESAGEVGSAASANTTDHEDLYSEKSDPKTIKNQTIFGSTLAEEPPTSTEPRGKPKLSPSQQMALDLKKLEYYQGSPQYPQMLREFTRKYEEGAAGKEQPKDEARSYSEQELQQGLAAQPLDYLRSSPKLQTELSSGPRQYDPITIMQQHGIMRFQGYAFPPSTELGKLKNVDEVKAVVDAHHGNRAVAAVRRSVNALLGRPNDKDDYLATGDKPLEDTHLLYRTVGLDAVQRRQMRFMLTDFDYADRQTTFHVMMSYPYTDWLHVLYMVLVGVALYELQVRYGAYEFYDEYLGLDLRQVPGLKKPMLAVISATVMVFILFQPLLIASVCTTRAYRIMMKRPIGPP